MSQATRFSLQPIPSIAHYSLCTLDVVRVGSKRQRFNIARVLEQFDTDLQTVNGLLLAGSALVPEATLVVPDLWHITKGRCKMFPPQDAEAILQLWYYAHHLARHYFTVQEPGTLTEDGQYHTLSELQPGFPASRYLQPL